LPKPFGQLRLAVVFEVVGGVDDNPADPERERLVAVLGES